MSPVTFVDEMEGLANDHDDQANSEVEDMEITGTIGSPTSSSVTQAVQSDTPLSDWTVVQTPRPASAPSRSDSIHNAFQRDLTSLRYPGPMCGPTQLPSINSLISRPDLGFDLAPLPHHQEQHPSFIERNIPPLPSIYLEKAVWPLKDPAEALLLRHYVQNLAIWVCTA